MPSLASVFTQGTAARHDLNQYYAAQIPPGHTIGSIVISPSLATGMSIDLVTEDVVYDGSGPTFVPSVDQTVTVTTVPAAGLTLLQDWNNRIGAPGVVWAQRFLSQTDVNRGVSGGGHTSQQWVSNDGIMSDGCLSQVVPANQGTGGRWHRPMMPMAGDINQPGYTTFPTVSNFPDTRGGVANSYIGNAAYGLTPHGSPLRTGTNMADEFYFQYRFKASTGRFNGNQPRGKMVMFETSWTNPDQELVITAGRGDAASSAITCYTNQADFGSSLANPQQSSGAGGNDQLQPNGNPSCTINNPGACINWTENQWITILVRWKAGLRAVNTGVPPTDSQNNPARNSRVTIWRALPGETSYTMIHDKSDYVWTYSNDATYGSGNALHAWGMNWVGLDFYTGGASFINSPTGFYHRFDQLIFSTQPIACPQA